MASARIPARRSVLYVDDEHDNRQLFERQFGETYNVVTAPDAQRALAVLQRVPIDVLLADARMPGMNGIELLHRVLGEFPEIGRVIVSADADRLLAAMDSGHAHEYVLKPWTREELGGCIARGLELADRRRRLVAQAELAGAAGRAGVAERGPWARVAATRGLDRAVALARRAAQTDATVLIRGETGTGKEVFARLIHEASARADRPFVRVSCATLADPQVVQALVDGRLEQAQGGTVFLDGIGDISPSIQLALLRMLQELELERAAVARGALHGVRVLAASHHDLLEEVQSGRFREDLYYRLNVLAIQLPALRERPEDIAPLARHFLAKHGHGARRIAPLAAAALERYAWPGNVRELENLVHRALVLSGSDVLEIDDFCLPLAPGGGPDDVRTEARNHEAHELRELLRVHGGNCARASRALGIPRTTLVSRAKRFGLL